MGGRCYCFFCREFLNKGIIGSVECVKWFVVGIVVYNGVIWVEGVFWVIFVCCFIFLFYFFGGGVKSVYLVIIGV